MSNEIVTWVTKKVARVITCATSASNADLWCNDLNDVTNNSIYDIECLVVSKWPNYGQRNWRLKNCAKIRGGA